jgi:16S rRNA (guanine(527)-N(7))-methyltransferase RsmG
VTADPRLERWLAALAAGPGLTAVRDLAEARRVHVDDALAAAELVRDGPVVDVGSGGGSPGIPLAVALPEIEFTLLETHRRKVRFLERVAQGLPNVEVMWGRAEECPVDTFAVALAKALARPPVAAELCLPLVRPGGLALLWVGETAQREAVARVAERLGARLEEDAEGLLVVRSSRRRHPASRAGPAWRGSVRWPRRRRALRGSGRARPFDGIHVRAPARSRSASRHDGDCTSRPRL